MRRAIIQQGALYIPGSNTASSYKQVIRAAQGIQRERINNDVTEKYNDRRADVTTRMAAEYEQIDNEIDRGKRTTAVKHLADPTEIKRVEDEWEEKREAEYKRVGIAFDKENEAIDREEAEERTHSEEELTRVIEELTEQIRRSGNLNPNSYLSKLREERSKAIFERDTAEDEETARAAARRVGELDQQIRSVERGDDYSRTTSKSDNTNGTNFRLASIQTIMGANQMLSGAENMNFGSIIAGAGQALGGVASAFGPYGAIAGAGISTISSILGGVASLVQNQAQKSDQMAGLAALIKNNPSFGGGTIENAREQMFSSLYNYKPGKSDRLVDIYDLGMSTPDFAQSAARRIRQRGMANEGVSEAYYQEALERVFSLDAGSLGQAGKYDRYGINATDAISNLVERLSRISNSGVSQGNYARVQEYFNLQQALMQQHLKFDSTPNIGLVNKEIEAIASMKGYTVNENTANDLQTARNAITNPQNDRLKAILYSTIEEEIPEYIDENGRNFGSTAGRFDLMKRAINNPNYQGKILQAYFRKIQNMYGSTYDRMGYDAFSYILPTMTDTNRDAVVENIIAGKLTNEQIVNQIKLGGGDGGKVLFAQEAKGYTSDVSQLATQMSDSVYTAIENLGNELSSAIDKAVREISRLF